MTFFVQHNSGRVFIDTRLHITSTSIEEIEADSFIEARLLLNELEFDKVDGYGWFLPGVRNG
jgi:hypothetical protein